jgi:hypothetical protein
MLPKKLFTPKCLHLDRDIVFREDLGNFFRHTIQYINEHKLTLIDYKIFKQLFNKHKISMLHFSKSKEENQKEYYEVLFGEIQLFMIEDRLKPNEKDYTFIFKVLAIFTLYSVYYTQTTDYYYQINTVPEILIEINKVISALSMLTNYLSIRNEIILMMDRLYKDEAFSIGAIVGLKTIILNKYGLPLDLKENTFNDYIDINQSAEKLEVFENKSVLDNFDSKLTDYAILKKNIIDGIKSLAIEFEDFDVQGYTNFINNNISADNAIKEEDLLNRNVSNIDLLLNQVDSKLQKFKIEKP